MEKGKAEIYVRVEVKLYVNERYVWFRERRLASFWSPPLNPLYLQSDSTSVTLRSRVWIKQARVVECLLS